MKDIAVHHKTNTNRAGVGIDGFDPVSYFELIQSLPRNGLSKFKSEYDGVTYYFRNSENKKAFDKNPLAYLPQYGGFCATAISEGNAVPVDPQTFFIKNNKLYLFYNDLLGNNTLNDWQSNLEMRELSAEEHWSSGKVEYLGKGYRYSSLLTRIKKKLFNY